MKFPEGLGKEIQKSFDLNAKSYLEDDIHWGDDSDLIYCEGKLLKKALGRSIHVFYPGVGPGHILIQLLSKKSFFEKVTAIDYSPNMVRLARERVLRLSKLEPNVRNKVDLKVMDLLDFKGNAEEFDMVLFLNNTLGNVMLDRSGAIVRNMVLGKFFKCLTVNGLLFLSVYNIERIKFINGFYTPRLKILKRIGDQDFLLQLNVNGEKHMFYTHWFTLKELRNLIVEAGFEIVRDEERRERIIVCAKKRGGR